MTYVKGTNRVIFNMKVLERLTIAAAHRALREEGNDVMQDSKENYVPVDTGKLQRSGSVAHPVKTQKQSSVRLSYFAPYARRTHENIRAGHTEGESPHGRKYKHWAKKGMFKFLERPIMVEAGVFKFKIATKLKLALRMLRLG